MAPTLEILGPELLDEEASLRSGTEKREESDATEATSFSEDKTLNSLDLDTVESEGPPAGRKRSLSVPSHTYFRPPDISIILTNTVKV